MAVRHLGPLAHAKCIRSSSLAYPRVFVHRIRLRSKAGCSVPDQTIRTSAPVSSQATPRMEFRFWTDDGRDDPDEYMEHVRICNAGIDRAKEFIQFVVEDKSVGYIHPGFAVHLSRFDNVFSVPSVVGNKEYRDNVANPLITLNPVLRSPEERTHAVAGVLEVLRDEGVIPGWRHELLSVVPSFGAPPLLALERAAVPFFGTKAYGVHMNGYALQNGKKYLWVAKRSSTKQTFPGMLDHLVAGGQPQGLSCKENLVKECEEEAGISNSLAAKAIATGAVSYETINGQTYKRDVLFCYDLELPQDFQPSNADGEVESFMLLPLAQVSKILRSTKMYKPNCALVVIDFLIRHGGICSSFKDFVVVIVDDRSWVNFTFGPSHQAAATGQYAALYIEPNQYTVRRLRRAKEFPARWWKIWNCSNVLAQFSVHLPGLHFVKPIMVKDKMYSRVVTNPHQIIIHCTQSCTWLTGFFDKVTSD